MPYPNDPDVMRGDKQRYQVVRESDGKILRRGLTQSDAIRYATAYARSHRNATGGVGGVARIEPM